MCIIRTFLNSLLLFLMVLHVYVIAKILEPTVWLSDETAENMAAAKC